MKGVILAGGEGSRLSLPYNKQTALVYDKPMIKYPLESLKNMGCEGAVVVSGALGIVDVFKTLKQEPNLQYVIQKTESGGMAEALAAAEGYVGGVFPVLCGDVYFDPAPPVSEVPALIYTEFEGAQNHTVWNPETNELVEKPTRDIGRKAIVAYWFDERVFELLHDITKSERGELELIDIYRHYLEQGAPVLEHQGFFGDMGTHDGLLRVANYEQARVKENI